VSPDVAAVVVFDATHHDGERDGVGFGRGAEYEGGELVAVSVVFAFDAGQGACAGILRLANFVLKCQVEPPRHVNTDTGQHIQDRHLI
jgi:hypothetical protein